MTENMEKGFFSDFSFCKKKKKCNIRIFFIKKYPFLLN